MESKKVDINFLEKENKSLEAQIKELKNDVQYYKEIGQTFEKGYNYLNTKNHRAEMLAELKFLYEECELGNAIEERLEKIIKKATEPS